MKSEIALLIFGATGDLAKRKIFPGLLKLRNKSKAFRNIKIAGVSRRNYTNSDFVDYLNKEIFTNEDATALTESVDFIGGYFDKPELYNKIYSYLTTNNIKKVYIHFSVPPINYIEILNGFIGIATPDIEFIYLVEKPFGNSPADGKNLKNFLTSNSLERKFFVIDHYLYKKINSQLLKFRFSTGILESAFNKDYVEKIEVKLCEEIGVETRGAFYDSVGALTDVGQNHALEMLAMVTMEKPDQFVEESYSEKRLWALKSFKPKVETLQYAQYKSYKTIKDVKVNSKTETYFKFSLDLTSPRWRGVTATIEAGKKIEKEDKSVTVNFFNGDIFKISFDSQNEVIYAEINKKVIKFGKEMENFSDQTYISEYTKAFAEIILQNKSANLVTPEESFALWDVIDDLYNYKLAHPEKLVIYEDGTTPVFNLNLENEPNKEIGIIGLGKMGGGAAYNFLEKGWNVKVYNRTKERMKNFIQNGVKGFDSIEKLCKSLTTPKKILIYLPSGDAVEQIIFGDNGLIKYLNAGDTIIDGGNSYYKDSLRRYELLKKKEINFIDMGSSGGPEGARYGATLMVGGEPNVLKRNEYIFKDLAEPGGYTLLSNPGEGHFVKMVHNGIEYGMMESIAEGFELIQKYSENIDLKEIAGVYSAGSIIESRLILWLWQALLLYTNKLETISEVTPHTGMGDWTVMAGKEYGVDVTAIENSLNFRINSINKPRFAGKIVTAIRHMFGRHDKD